MLIAVPSFSLLYILDEVISPSMTIKAVGHQWYWSSLNSHFVDYLFNFYLHNASNGEYLQLEILKSITPIILHKKYTGEHKLTTLDVSPVHSENHDNTLVVLERALLSDLFSTEVRDFLKNTKGQKLLSLCYLAPNGELIIPEGISLGTKGQLPLHNFQSGIYVITQNDTDNFYLGSTLNHATRLRSHRDLGSSERWLTQQHLLYSSIARLGPNAFTYTVIHPCTNFFTSFNETYPEFVLSSKDIQLLEAYTKYELAIVEQGYLTRFKPKLNGRFVATTSTHPHLLSHNTDSLHPLQNSSYSELEEITLECHSSNGYLSLP